MPNNTIPGSSGTSTSSIAASTTSSASSPTVPAVINNFTYISCYTEATNGRALTGFSLPDNSITLQTCASNCTGFQYFGVEYARGKQYP